MPYLHLAELSHYCTIALLHNRTTVQSYSRTIAFMHYCEFTLPHLFTAILLLDLSGDLSLILKMENAYCLLLVALRRLLTLKVEMHLLEEPDVGTLLMKERKKLRSSGIRTRDPI